MKKIKLLRHYEHKSEPIVPLAVFFARLLRSLAFAALVVASALSVGILGYRFIAGLGWIDSYLNAAMILGGMGPVSELRSSSAKIFAGCYALFSGIVFVAVVGIIFAPILHRFLHRFHLEGGKK